jgi:hypothetical protein
MSATKDPMIVAAEAEIASLEATLQARRAALDWMKALAVSSTKTGFSATLTAKKETWADRIDRALRHLARPSTVAEIVKALEPEGVFEGIEMDPQSLIRANLNRVHDRYGWKGTKHAGVVRWVAYDRKEGGGP